MVVSHVVHYRYDGRLFAYGPYAREIDIWADLFPQVLIASPCRHRRPPGDCLAFTRTNISIRPQLESGGRTALAKLRQLPLLPVVVWRLIQTIRQADAIHVRCPGNLGLLGSILAPFFSRYRIAKYAGQWNSHTSEPLSFRLQRWILSSRWWNAPVTVYGNWAKQPRHVLPFFTSMMTKEQVDCSIAIAAEKQIVRPLRVLFSGSLLPGKRVDALLRAVAVAVQRGVPLEVVIVGDGPLHADLHRLRSELGIDDYVRFVGALPFDDAIKWCEWAHCLVLPSRSEGWPKVVAEAMCHGVVCMAVDHGQVSSMLAGRGILLEAGSPIEIADALWQIADQPDRFRPISQRACAWAQEYSLETLQDALAELLSRQWDVELPNPMSVPARTRLTHASSV